MGFSLYTIVLSEKSGVALKKLSAFKYDLDKLLEHNKSLREVK